MTLGHHKLSEYGKRIERAKHLAAEFSFAAKPLKFYALIARFQKELFFHLMQEWGTQPVAPASGGLRSELNFTALLPKYSSFLALVEANAPQPLVTAASELSRGGSNSWIALLTEYWGEGGKAAQERDSEAGRKRGALEEFLARGFLQGCAEFVAEAVPEPAIAGTKYFCPKCNSLPVLGVLKPEGDGGKRFLHCAFCAHEWTFRRILCPACGEEREEKLPVYVAEQFPYIRVECCDTCRSYLRTIDLTKDGNAVPETDDVAAIPLTLWAQENGYSRIHTNLLGA